MQLSPIGTFVISACVTVISNDRLHHICEPTSKQKIWSKQIMSHSEWKQTGLDGILRSLMEPNGRSRQIPPCKLKSSVRCWSTVFKCIRGEQHRRASSGLTSLKMTHLLWVLLFSCSFLAALLSCTRLLFFFFVFRANSEILSAR